jgi:hypothetical protein
MAIQHRPALVAARCYAQGEAPRTFSSKYSTRLAVGFTCSTKRAVSSSVGMGGSVSEYPLESAGGNTGVTVQRKLVQSDAVAGMANIRGNSSSFSESAFRPFHRFSPILD